jgi:hypothetical protein
VNSGRHGRREGQRPFAGTPPKLSTKRQAELRRMHKSGDYSITDLAEVLDLSTDGLPNPPTDHPRRRQIALKVHRQKALKSQLVKMVRKSVHILFR